MNRATKLALAIALLIAAGANIGQSAAATAPPTEPPSPDVGPPVPADFVMLVDDTGTINVQVPGSWNDTSTAQVGVIPTIEASPDLDAYHAAFDVPGMTYRAAPFSEDTDAAARDFGLDSGCVNERIEPYDDGVFVGSQLIYTECGGAGSPAEFHVIAANPVNDAFTAQLRIQITGPQDLPILEGILNTFNMSAQPVNPTPTTAGPAPSTSTSGSPGIFPPPSGEIPADWTPLIDDTETIVIAVPSAWTGVDLVPATNADGSPQPWISATTDQALFIPAEGTADTFSVPGVIYRADPFEADTTARLASSSLHDVCVAGPVQTYDDGAFVGHIQSFEQCGGTATRIVRVVANAPDEAFTADLLVQLTGLPDDSATLDGLLSSFNTASGTVAPTTVAGATTSPVATSDPAVALLQQQLFDGLGLTITEEQARCILGDAEQIDPNDAAATLSILLQCGVDVLDLASG
jgi:hypothetical protein